MARQPNIVTFFVSVFLLFFTHSTNAAPQTSTSTTCTNGLVRNGACRIECGTDYAGGDYQVIQVSSLDQCVTACDQDIRCTDAQYTNKGSPKFCYLKSQLTRATKKDGIDSVICRLKPACAQGQFSIQVISFEGQPDPTYWQDFGVNGAFVGITSDPTQAGRFTLDGTTLKSVAVPNAVVLSRLENGRTASRPLRIATLNAPEADQGRTLVVQLADRNKCTLSFTDGYDEVIVLYGTRGGTQVHIAPPGTTSTNEFSVPLRVVAVKL